MHKCRSYDPDKLIYISFKCAIDLQPSLKVFQKAVFLLKDNNCAK